jgi:DHA2 family multidrug resistance protein
VDHGSALAQAQHQAFAWVGQQVQSQAAFLAFADVFWTLAVFSAATVPLALILRRSTPGGQHGSSENKRPGAH